MTVPESAFQRGYNEETNKSEIKSIYHEVSQLLDINFFLDDSELSEKLDNESIAQVIKGTSYEKTKKKIKEFKDQCKVTLENIKMNQNKLRNELNAYINNIRMGDSATQAQVMYGRANGARDEDIEKFVKNQVELRKKMTDKADQIKKKYDDEVSKYNDKDMEFKEKLVVKIEELKPALDQDIIALLGKLKQLVFSRIQNEEFFNAFILGNLTKVVYTFLYDVIDGIAAQHEASRIFDELNVEMNKVVNNKFQLLKSGFLAHENYLNKCYALNKYLLIDIENIIKNLPYKQCENNKPSIEYILGIPTEKTFHYKGVIDPEKLSNIKKEIEIYKSELQKSQNEIHIVLDNNLPVFDNLDAFITSLNTKYNQMNKNKEELLTPVCKELYFTLGLLNEGNHIFYMKDHKKLINDISNNFDNVNKVQLSEMLEKIKKTDMFLIPAAQSMENNAALSYSKYKEKLIIKKGEISNKISELDRLLTEIDDIPKTSSLKYKLKISNELKIALIPLANIIILISMYFVINKLKPAIKSKNPFYDELFRVILNKFKISMYIHIGLAVILGLISLAAFALSTTTKYLFVVSMLIYIITSVMLYSQRLILKRFKGNIVQ